jgi:hypothetical protein
LPFADKIASRVFFGKIDIVHALKQLPSSRHNPADMVVDAVLLQGIGNNAVRI